MKSLVSALAVALLAAAPALSQAQEQSGLTRAQVKADLAAVEQAGYNPNDWLHYPENIQAAEARVHAQDYAAGARSADTSAQAPSDGLGR
jgi:hypothetical protein